MPFLLQLYLELDPQPLPVYIPLLSFYSDHPISKVGGILIINLKMESGSRIGGLIPNVEKEVINGATETNLVDERLKQTNQNSNLNKVVL